MAYKAITLTALIVGVKGGPGSGNRGHAGRPGKLGGSVGKGAGLALPPGVSFINEFPKQLTTDYGLSPADVANMFSVEGMQTNIGFETQNYSPENKTVTLDVTWNDPKLGVNPNINLAGNAERVFTTIDGEKYCNNALLGIGVQNTGIGTQLYAKQIAMLKNKGFAAITLHADSDIGRYAWAKQGFQYGISDGSKENIQFHHWAANRGITVPNKFNGKTPQDFANFKLPGVKLYGDQISNPSVPKDLLMDVGKAFMLDKANGHGDWDAFLPLK